MAVRVLLVEDSREDLELALRVIQRKAQGVRILHAADGLSAWKMLDDPSTKLDLVLTDIKLPGLSGLDLLEKVRKEPRFKCMPVVVLTSSREDRDVKRAYELGANSYIVKPVEPTTFGEVLEHVTQYWTRVNVAAP